MVIPAATNGGLANQQSVCKERTMSDTIGNGVMDEATVEATAMSEVVELGDVVEETKGQLLGSLADIIAAFRIG
jgi:hypothetical protein